MLSRPYRVIPLLAERICVGLDWSLLACSSYAMHVYVGVRAPNAKYDAHASYLLDISYCFLLPSNTIVHLGPWDSVVSILHLFICLCEFLGPLHLNPKGSKNKIPQFSSSTTMYQKMVHCLPPTLTHAKWTHYWIPLLIRFSQVRTFLIPLVK